MSRLLSLSLILLFPFFANAQSGWIRDYSQGLAEAKKTGKPLFVVFRCDPCDDTAEFDRQVTHWKDDHFVRVRLNRITGVDLNLFDFDYDNTWYGLFLDANERILGRFGGRDGESPTSYLSIPALKFAMEEAQKRHARKEDAPPDRGLSRKVEDYPAAKKVRGNACIHCHLAKVFDWEASKLKKTWSRDDFFVYPTPDNLGFTLQKDRGDTVESVKKGGNADKLGIEPGDRIVCLNGTPVASFADACYGLHRAPKSGSIPVVWLHGDVERKGNFDLKEGWRKTDLSWRPSMFEFIPKLQLSGDDLEEAEKKSLGLDEKRFAMRHDKFVHSTLKQVGVKENDIVVGADGGVFEGTTKQFQAFVKKNYLSGDKIVLNLLRDGKRVDVEMVLK